MTKEDIIYLINNIELNGLESSLGIAKTQFDKKNTADEFMDLLAILRISNKYINNK